MSKEISSNNQKAFDVENAKNTLDRIIGFVNNCDSKASIMLGIFGVLVTIVFTSSALHSLNDILIVVGLKCIICGLSLLIGFIISSVLFLWGIGKFIIVLTAKVKPSGKDSRIYFRDIAENKNLEHYKAKLLNMDENDLLDDYVSEMFENAKICSSKYKTYNIGLRISLIGLILFLVLFGMGNLFISS